jgi:3-oxoacyl-[acyl-carrier protein] reductase
VRADISHPGGSKKLIQTVKEHSSDLRRAEEAFKIDVIVNNAGVASNAAIEDIEPE